MKKASYFYEAFLVAGNLEKSNEFLKDYYKIVCVNMIFEKSKFLLYFIANVLFLIFVVLARKFSDHFMNDLKILGVLNAIQ